MAENTQATEVTNEVTTTTPKQEVRQPVNLQTDYSQGLFATSNNFKMAWQMAQALSQSTVVPQAFQGNPSNCLVALETANRFNLSPFMTMQNLYIISGKPSWSSKFLIALINGSGLYDTELCFDETKDKDGKPFSCTAYAMKNGRRIEGMTVDMNMARDEGWLGKNGSKWKTMPQLMLRYRAASFFASLNCPQISLGFYTAEEMQDSTILDNTVDVKTQVQNEIEANANQIEFDDVIEDAKA